MTRNALRHWYAILRKLGKGPDTRPLDAAEAWHAYLNSPEVHAQSRSHIYRKASSNAKAKAHCGPESLAYAETPASEGRPRQDSLDSELLRAFRDGRQLPHLPDSRQLQRSDSAGALGSPASSSLDPFTPSIARHSSLSGHIESPLTSSSDLARPFLPDAVAPQTSKDPIDKPSDLLLRAIQKLTPEDREVILMRYAKRQSYEKMSEHLGCTREAARRLCSEALERLQATLRQ